MKPTFTTLLEGLNKDWKNFIEQQRLWILSNSTEEVVDFLSHLHFVEPNILTDTFDIDTGGHSYPNVFASWEFSVEFKGDLEFEEPNHFTIACHEIYDQGSYSICDWKVNSALIEAYETDGLSFTDYLWDLNLDEKYDELINNMFYSFSLLAKIKELFPILSEEKAAEKHKSLIEKYNETQIKVVEESGQLFIVLHDGLKVPFSTEE
ncbi:hypothetical protein ACWKTZ_24365 [Bacillus cereus]|uniref:hypothetical protein n=1 Tax=Bacillus cereus TaxID=1396 RepID=UPI00307A513F